MTYDEATDKVMKEIRAHMKSHGWDLDFGFQREEIFYKVHGHHLEDFLINRILASKDLVLKFKNGKGIPGLFIGKIAKKKVRRKK